MSKKKTLKNILTVLLLLVLGLSLNSCQRFVYNTFIIGKTGLKTKSKLVDEKGKREVILIPMVHMEKAKYYDEIRVFLDSLKAEGYVVFYEGVGFTKEQKISIDSLARDTLQRKFRKVTNMHLSEFDREDNLSLPGYIRNNKKLVFQSVEKLGLTTDRDKRVDLSMPELIEQYEKNKGEIILNEYDLQTGLNEKYRCDDPKKYDEYYLLFTLRNNKLIYEISNTQYPKVVVVYGKQHIPTIGLTLTKQMGYTYIR